MAAMPPRAGRRARQATQTTTRARPPQPPGSRRDRLLVLVLTLALVTAGGTRALADSDDGGSSGEASGPQTEQSQSQPETQQPAAVNPDSSGDDNSAVMTGDLLQVTDPGGEEHPETPVVATQGQPGTTGEQVAHTQDQPDQARPRESRGDHAAGCADGLCLQEPPGPKEPPGPRILAATVPPNGGQENGDEGNGDEGNGDENGEPVDYSSLPVEQQVSYIEGELNAIQSMIDGLRDAPDHILFPEVTVAMIHEMLDEHLGFINGVMEPHAVEGALSPEQVAGLRGTAEDLRRQVQAIPLGMGMDPDSPDAIFRLLRVSITLNDSVLNEVEEDFHRDLLEGERTRLEADLRRLEQWESQALLTPDQQNRLQSLKDRIQRGLETLPMSSVRLDLLLPGRQPQDHRPVVVPPPPPGDMSGMDHGVPPSVAVAQRPVVGPAPYDGGKPEEVVKPVPPLRPTSEQELNRGIWTRIDEQFEHAPRPDATVTIDGIVGLLGGTALWRALWLTHTGRMLLAIPYVLNETLKALPAAPGPTPG
jgi:hypothetical protein